MPPMATITSAWVRSPICFCTRLKNSFRQLLPNPDAVLELYRRIREWTLP